MDKGGKAKFLIAKQSTAPALIPASEDPQSLMDVVLDLLEAFPSLVSKETASRRIIEYCEVLGEYPLEAVKAAAIKFRRGKVEGNPGRFAPTAAEWAIEARKLLDKMLPDRRHDVPPELILNRENQLAAAPLLQELARNLRSKTNPPAAEKTIVSPDEDLEASKNDTSGISLSAEALANISKQ